MISVNNQQIQANYETKYKLGRVHRLVSNTLTSSEEFFFIKGPLIQILWSSTFCFPKTQLMKQNKLKIVKQTHKKIQCQL